MPAVSGARRSKQIAPAFWTGLPAGFVASR